MDLLSGFGNAISRFFFKNGSYYQNSYVFGQKGNVYIDTDKPNMAYSEIPQLKTVVDKIGSMFSNGRYILEDIKTGEQVEDKELMKLLENPHCTQSQNEFLKSIALNYCLFGNAFTYANKASNITPYPQALISVPSYFISPDLTGDFFDQTEISGIIKKYDVVNSGIFKRKFFETDEILHIKIPDPNNPIIGLSPIHALKFPLSNTKEAYKFLNNISVNLGPKTIIGLRGVKDAAGIKPPDDEERERMEKQYNNDYGNNDGQRKVLISTNEAYAQMLSFPTGQMILLEQIDANMLTIIDAYGLNANIFANKNSTFENTKNGLIQSYQDVIYPLADTWTQALSKWKMINLKEGTRLRLSYDYLDIMKENKLKGTQSIVSITQALTQAVQAGILKQVEATTILANELANLTN